MRPTIGVLLVSALLAVAPLWAATASIDGGTETREWNFRVLLDDSEIGFHRFRLTNSGGERRLTSEARFDVRVLFVTAYRYWHVNEEIWQGRCLSRIEADTDANGREQSIVGTRADDAFVVDTGAQVRELPGCVMSFAYWDPAFLEEQRLLNPQTGEYLDVDIEKVDECTLEVRGKRIRAAHYRIRARGLNVDVWYSADRQWVALESEAKGGRKIRYELT